MGLGNALYTAPHSERRGRNVANSVRIRQVVPSPVPSRVFAVLLSHGAIGSRRCRKRCTGPGIPTGQRIGWTPRGAYDRDVMRAMFRLCGRTVFYREIPRPADQSQLLQLSQTQWTASPTRAHDLTDGVSRAHSPRVFTGCFKTSPSWSGRGRHTRDEGSLVGNRRVIKRISRRRIFFEPTGRALDHPSVVTRTAMQPSGPLSLPAAPECSKPAVLSQRGAVSPRRRSADRWQSRRRATTARCG